MDWTNRLRMTTFKLPSTGVKLNIALRKKSNRVSELTINGETFEGCPYLWIGNYYHVLLFCPWLYHQIIELLLTITEYAFTRIKCYNKLP